MQERGGIAADRFPRVGLARPIGSLNSDPASGAAMPTPLFIAISRNSSEWRSVSCLAAARERARSKHHQNTPRYSSEDHPGSLAADQSARRGPCLCPILTLGVSNPARTMARSLRPPADPLEPGPGRRLSTPPPRSRLSRSRRWRPANPACDLRSDASSRGAASRDRISPATNKESEASRFRHTALLARQGPG